MSRIDIRHGDSREVLKTLADASIDSVVCDPPYALVSIGKRFGKEGAAPAKAGKTGAYQRASAGFMGKTWDTGETAFAVEFWAEVYRVLKPGGHVVAFGGTRAVHRLVCAIEDAEFEIRDTLCWHFASGFPKSHNVSKAIDKAAGVDFTASPAGGVGFMGPEGPGGYNVTKNQLTRVGERTPEAAQWDGWGTALKPATELICLARKPLIGTVAANVLAHGVGALNIDATRIGWQSDADAAAAATAGFAGMRANGKGKQSPSIGKESRDGTNSYDPAALTGRWPANLLHDGSEAVLAAFPDEAARFFFSAKASKSDRVTGRTEEVVIQWISDQGPRRVKLLVDTAQSRPKVIGGSESITDSEWNTFLSGSTITDLFLVATKSTTSAKTNSTTPSAIWNLLTRSLTSACIEDASCDPECGGSPADSAVSSGRSITITLGKTAFLPDANRALSGTQLTISVSAKQHGHPTVKPLDLMRWLVRLVTPPSGTVLDPFAGTGSTGVACIAEGFNAILIEREAEYVADIHRRIAWANGEGRLTAQEHARTPDLGEEGLPLFATHDTAQPASQPASQRLVYGKFARDAASDQRG